MAWRLMFDCGAAGGVSTFNGGDDHVAAVERYLDTLELPPLIRATLLARATHDPGSFRYLDEDDYEYFLEETW